MSAEAAPHAVDLVALVQTLARRKSTAMLVLSGPGRQGAILLSDGEIVHATSGAVRGEEALLDLLSWTTGSIQISPLGQVTSRTIDEGLASRVLAGCVQRTANGA